jgi:hypothetical protein
MSAPDDSYRTAPTKELIDDLLDNRPAVFRRAKTELLARLANPCQRREGQCHRFKRAGPLRHP